jgi:CPA1 family monovalent cation:H+ antiporter
VDVLSALLVELILIVVLFEVARRLGLPYPSLFVLGGAVIGFIPGVPRLTLSPDLVLLVFLPPLLFGAAFDTPLRDLRRNLWPIGRLSMGLVVLTMLTVAAIAHALVPNLGWAPAFTLGAIVAPTDALAATAVFRRQPVPRTITAIVEGEALFNDATALIAYRFAVAATLTGSFVAANAIGGFLVAAVGGVAVGYLVGRASGYLLRWLDDPPVEVVVSLLIPFLAYLAAQMIDVSAVLAVVTAGLLVGRRLGTALSPNSRVLWFTTWKMVGFVLNGLAFVLIGLALPSAVSNLGGVRLVDAVGVAAAVSVVAILTRYVWIFLSSLLPWAPRRTFARNDPALAWRLVVMVGWTGLRGAVSLAAALALPVDFPQRNLILLVTFGVILVTLVGQGLTLPWVLRWVRWDGSDGEAHEAAFARATMYQVGLDTVRGIRPYWPGHEPLLNRLESGLMDREQHLATDDPDETATRTQEHEEHERIQLTVLNAQRSALVELRDAGEINDAVLRTLERELDLEELRMEA